MRKLAFRFRKIKENYNLFRNDIKRLLGPQETETLLNIRQQIESHTDVRNQNVQMGKDGNIKSGPDLGSRRPQALFDICYAENFFWGGAILCFVGPSFLILTLFLSFICPFLLIFDLRRPPFPYGPQALCLVCLMVNPTLVVITSN